MSLHHDAKLEPTAFNAVVNGERRVECLQTEGNFKLDDLVTLREFTPATSQFTGRTFTAKIQGVEKASDNIGATLTVGEPIADE